MWSNRTKPESSPFNIDKITAEALATIIRDAGFKAVVNENPDGSHTIASASNGWNSLVRLLNKSGEEYKSFQFNLWLTDEERSISLASMNDFNSHWRYIKGLVDASDNSIGLQMDVDLEGGVSPLFLAKRISLWDSLVASFRRHMAEKNK